MITSTKIHLSARRLVDLELPATVPSPVLDTGGGAPGEFRRQA